MSESKDEKSDYRGSWFAALSPPPKWKAVWRWIDYFDSRMECFGIASDVVEYEEFYQTNLRSSDLPLLGLLDLNPTKPVIRIGFERHLPVVVVYPKNGPGFIGAFFEAGGVKRILKANGRPTKKAMEWRDRFLSNPLANTSMVKPMGALTAQYQWFPFNGQECSFDGLRIAATPAEEVRILTDRRRTEQLPPFLW